MSKKTREPHPQRDYWQLSVRFACGALMGIFIAVFFIWNGMTFKGAIALSAIAALICGFLAARYGDKFWEILGS